MPRYFFNVYDGVYRWDNEGTELDGPLEAHRDGIRFAGQVISERSCVAEPGDGDWSMEVTDETGLVLFRFAFLVSTTAATTSLLKRDAAND